MLKEILEAAYGQATKGKGAKRHANGRNYRDQPIFWIEDYFPSFQLGQAVKKIEESQRLNPEDAVKELEGAIIYIAAKIQLIKEKIEKDLEKD